MAKKPEHKWNYQEQLFCIEYAIKHYKNRDWNTICKEAADYVNKNISETNNPTTEGSVKMGYNHIIQFLNGSTEGLGAGPKGYQDAIKEAMKKQVEKLRNQKRDQQLKHAMAGFFGLILGKVIN